MSFEFEKFTDTGTSYSARATIRRTGQIGFNSGAVNRYGIHDYAYAILYFDTKRRVVGIGLETGKSEGAIEIRKSNTNTYIRARNFCDRYGMDYTESHRYELKQDPESKFLYFELDEEKATGARRNRKADAKPG